jgi:phage/plasmid-associated DNA primase
MEDNTRQTNGEIPIIPSGKNISEMRKNLNEFFDTLIDRESWTCVVSDFSKLHYEIGDVLKKDDKNLQEFLQKNYYYQWNCYPIEQPLDTIRGVKDKHIISKRFFVVDFDIRSIIHEETKEIISDEKLWDIFLAIKSGLDAHDLLKQYHYIISSWNGYHVMYVLNEHVCFDAEEYKQIAENFLKSIGFLLWDAGKYIDASCTNYSRKWPVPFTINPKRKEKYSLPPKSREITVINKDSFIVLEDIKNFISETLEDFTPTDSPLSTKKSMSWVCQVINTIPINELVEHFYPSLTPTSDGKNFLSPTDGKNIGAFVNDKNLLVLNGTHHIQAPSWGKSAYNSFSFVRDHIHAKSSYEVVEWFKNKYPSITSIVESKPIAKYPDYESEVDKFLQMNWEKRELDNYNYALHLIDKRYIKSATSVFVYNPKSKIYEDYSEIELKRDINNNRFDMNMKKIKQADTNEIYTFIRQCSYDKLLLKKLEDKETRQFWITFKDCIVNLKTLEKINYNQDLFVISQFNYNSSILKSKPPTPKFDEFLDTFAEWYRDKNAFIKCLQEVLGSVLLPYVFTQSLFMYGKGKNGKGTICRIMTAVIGHDLFFEKWLNELDKPEWRSCLVGKICFIDSDIEQKVDLGKGIIKKIVTQEAIAVRSLYKDEIQYVPHLKVIACWNYKPKLSSTKDSILRRRVFLEWKWTIDKDRLPELANEHDGVMARLLEWAQRVIFNNNTIEVPPELSSYANEFTQDTVDEFVAYYNKDTFEAQQSYEEYCKYCTVNWLDPVNIKIYSTRIQELGYIKNRTSWGNVYTKKDLKPE